MDMEDRIKINEVIVVEGRDDESRLKQYFDVEVIITNGFRIKEKTFKLIEEVNNRVGVIVLTDPDYAGENIRKRLNERIKGLKNAFISMEDATLDGDIGIENATKESLVHALKNFRYVGETSDKFSNADMISLGLAGEDGSKNLRNKIGKILGIGYGNSKQFLSRLNKFGISRDEFIKAYEEVVRKNNG